jgi:hypothetical protein
MAVPERLYQRIIILLEEIGYVPDGAMEKLDEVFSIIENDPRNSDPVIEGRNG